ncbi:MAG: hypothetical protein AAFO70_02245 [Pseudomonadota bacterium]
MEQMPTVADLRPDPTFAAFNADWPYCLDTGLLTRAGFLERAGSELRRARRFERDLSLVRISPLDENLDHEEFEHLVFFVQESVRDGIDLAGLVAHRTIMLLLPETNMLGAMDFSLRLRDLANACREPRIADFTTRETVIREDDESLTAILSRCS